MTNKGKDIIKKCEKENIPYFVLSAKDEFSLYVLKKYYDSVYWSDCDEIFQQDILTILESFENWQNENKDLVKLPD